MLSHFDELLISTANDGASEAIGASPNQTRADIDDLMVAWYRERQECIEAQLFLDQARHLLRQIISEGEISVTNRRKAKRLLVAIKASRNSLQEND